MTNLEWLKSVKEVTIEDLSDKRMPLPKFAVDLRIMKALEIIAEELIKSNDIKRNMVATLENIETAIK